MTFQIDTAQWQQSPEDADVFFWCFKGRAYGRFQASTKTYSTWDGRAWVKQDKAPWEAIAVKE